MELAHRQVLHEGRAHLGRDDEQTIRLAVIQGDLGQEFVVGEPPRRPEFTRLCRLSKR
jgi:hypothetical protein